MKEAMELAVINAQNAVQVFTQGGMQALLDNIEAQVRAIGPLDASTHAGRDLIRSTAYRVARTKTALDAEGKRLTEGWREATKKVNEERKVASERLDALAEEVRKPLTDYENKERLRVEAHEEALKDITGLHAMIAAYPDMTAPLLAEHLEDLRKSNVDRDWEEFAYRAKSARADAERYILKRLEDRQRYDSEQAELARLRKEEAERIVREREERLKAEAAEKARLEAERKAKAEADAEAKRVIEAAEKERRRVAAEAERVRLENERSQQALEAKAAAERQALEAKARAIEEQRQAEEASRVAAERRAREAEAARVAAERKAAEDLKAAREKARKDAEAAIARERERIERERQAAERERIKRESDEARRQAVRADIIEDLAFAQSLLKSQGTAAIADAIMNGSVRHVKVVY